MPQKEYGGYIEFESQPGTEYHKEAIALNCGRNCLAYLIEARGIKKIYLPYFLCASVGDICRKYNVEIQYYHIDSKFRPIFDIDIHKKEYIYIVNYYGQISVNEIKKWEKKYPNLILDFAQSFFQKPIENSDTLYSCRQYFGVSDGAYLYTKSQIDRNIELDFSYDRMRFLMGRYEKTANEFYREYVENNRRFREVPILQMSKLTHNLLNGICYEKVKKRRTENFKILNEALGVYNRLKLDEPEGAFMYPLFIKNGAEIRKELQSKNIYIPTLWPDVFKVCQKSELEYDMAENILPLPVDQRYDKDDMEILSKVVSECIV